MWFNLARTVAEASWSRRPGVLLDPRELRPRTRAVNEARIRALTASAPIDADTVLCRVLGRYKMFVDRADAGLSPHLMLDGYWEMWVTEVMARRLRPGMTAADIGANLGYYTLLMADLVGPSGRVHAFEPNPAMVARLRANLAVNGFVAEVHPVALSDREGDPVRLVVPPGEPKNAHIVACPDLTPGDPLAFRTRRLDSFAQLEQVDFVKIDADAAEEGIWRGMEGLLRGGRPMTVVMEFAPIRYADPQGLLEAIAAAGFSLALIDHARGEQPATAEQILAGPAAEDRMLLLCR